MSTINHDLPCLTCGYNLRTLDLAARCPECGQPVHATPPNPVTNASARGATIAAVGILMVFASWSALFVDGMYQITNSLGHTGIYFAMMWTIATQAVWLIGIVLLTKPRSYDLRPVLCWFTRITAALSLLGITMIVICGLAWHDSRWAREFIVHMWCLTLATWALSLTGWGLWTWRIARSLKRTWLARQSLLIAFLIPLEVGALIAVLVLFFIVYSLFDPLPLSANVMIISFFGTGLTLPWTAAVSFLLARAIRRELKSPQSPTPPTP